jgi:hypothetical protein
MVTNLQTNNAEDRLLIDGLRHALDMNYSRMLDTARRQWEHHFAGKDPSDACVSVHVSSGNSQPLPLPCAGILRRQRRTPLNGNRHGVLA